MNELEYTGAMPSVRTRASVAHAKSDRRVSRTRAALHRALLGLILDRGWDAVNVQDLCLRADVGRSTFYSHFADKEELLLSGFDELREELRASSAGRGKLGFICGLLEHVTANRRLWRALVGRKSAYAVQNRFRVFVGDLTRDAFANDGIRVALLEPVVRYVAGAVTELMMWSLEHPKALPPRELSATCEVLTASVLARAQTLPGPEA